MVEPLGEGGRVLEVKSSIQHRIKTKCHISHDSHQNSHQKFHQKVLTLLKSAKADKKC